MLFNKIIIYGLFFGIIYLLACHSVQSIPNTIGLPSNSVSIASVYDLAGTIITDEPHSPIMFDLIESCLE